MGYPKTVDSGLYISENGLNLIVYQNGQYILAGKPTSEPTQFINTKECLMVMYDNNWNYMNHRLVNTRIRRITNYIKGTYFGYNDVRYTNGIVRKELIHYANMITTDQTFLDDDIIQVNNSDSKVYHVVLYTYKIGTGYNFDSLVLSLLNKDTADNNYNSPYINFTSLGWYKVKAPTTNSPYNPFVFSPYVSVSKDYIYVTSSPDPYLRFNIVIPQFVSLWSGNTLLVSNAPGVQFKTNKLGSFTIKSHIKDSVNRIINGKDQVVQVTSIAPNPS